MERENYLRELVTKTGYPREVLIRQIGISRAEAPLVQRAPRTAIREREISENERAQMQLIALLVRGLIPAGIIERQDFDCEIYAEIYDNFTEGIMPSSYIHSLPEEQLSRAMEAINYSPLPKTPESALQLAEELLHTIRRSRINSRISVLMEKMNTAAGEERSRLTTEINDLLQKL